MWSLFRLIRRKNPEVSWLGHRHPKCTCSIGRTKQTDNPGIFIPGKSNSFQLPAPLSSFHSNRQVSTSNTLSRSYYMPMINICDYCRVTWRANCTHSHSRQNPDVSGCFCGSLVQSDSSLILNKCNELIKSACLTAGSKSLPIFIFIDNNLWQMLEDYYTSSRFVREWEIGKSWSAAILGKKKNITVVDWTDRQTETPHQWACSANKTTQ